MTEVLKAQNSLPREVWEEPQKRCGIEDRKRQERGVQNIKKTGQQGTWSLKGSVREYRKQLFVGE